MALSADIYMYRSTKTKGLFCFSLNRLPAELPESLSPWRRFGVVRAAEKLPHGLKRESIEPGIRENGYQLYRRKPKAKA